MKRKYNTKVQIHFILCIFTTLLFSCETKSQKNDSTYLNEKKHFHSKLIKKEKAPQEYEDLVSTKDLLRVEYPSNGINLKALIIKKILTQRSESLFSSIYMEVLHWENKIY